MPERSKPAKSQQVKPETVKGWKEIAEFLERSNFRSSSSGDRKDFLSSSKPDLMSFPSLLSQYWTSARRLKENRAPFDSLDGCTPN